MTTYLCQKKMEKQKRVFTNAEKMFPVVENYYASKLSQKRFCEQNEVAPHLLTYWLRKYKTEQLSKQEKDLPKFVSLEISNKISTSRGLEVSYPNGTKLRLPEKVEWALLEQILIKLNDVSSNS